MNETKFTPKIGDVASPEAKKALLALNCVSGVKTAYGIQCINRGDAMDHAYMRSKQLSSLLLLMSGEGLLHFRLLNESAQDALMGLTHQLATETEAMFDIVVTDEAGGQS